MTGPFATRLFRIVFALAGLYNLAFGAWTVLWPLQFFTLLDLAPPRYPEIWSCLGMVVGLYGLLYWHAALWPERGRAIIAVGLAGKMLGPIGMLLNFGPDWPLRLGLLNVFNDLVWWLPFALFLARGTPVAASLESLAPWASALLHALGLAAMALLLRPGMLTETDAAARATHVATHPVLWTTGWVIWMLAAQSLVGFYAWWGARLALGRAAFRAAVLGVLLAGIGSMFDLTGETLSVLVLSERSDGVLTDAATWNSAPFTATERAATLLTAGIANLLYTLGGVRLTLATPDLPPVVRTLLWGTWIAGAAMTLAAIGNHVGGMVAATVVLFPLLIVWTIWMGRAWRRA